jgi:hypothetical protein
MISICYTLTVRIDATREIVGMQGIRAGDRHNWPVRAI